MAATFSDNESQASSDDEDDETLSPVVHVSRRAKDFDELRRIRCYPKPIRTLQLHIHFDHGYTDDEQRKFMFEVVHSLPLLRHIEVVAPCIPYTTRPPNRTWSVRLLMNLLENIPNIVSVRLLCFRLVGIYSDFEELGQKIRTLQYLERFSLDKISVAKLLGAPISADTKQGCWLGPVVNGLASLKKLQHVRILGSSDFEHVGLSENDAPPKGPVLQSNVLRDLCKSTSLRSLCLIHFNLSDDNVFHLAEQLKTNTSLKELDIDCTLDKDSSLALSRLLDCNKTLEDLNLCVRSKEDETISSEAQMEAEEEVNLRLAHGVGRSSLINFALFRGKVSPKSVDAFKAMIVNQSSLKSLTLYSGDDDSNESFSADPIISFYCKLNKFGRRSLLTDDPPGAPCAPAFFPPELALVDTMGRLSDDVSCLYYFLSAKPAICNRAIQKMEEEERMNSLNRKRRATRRPPSQAPAIKRTRLYREAKYRNISYTD